MRARCFVLFGVGGEEAGKGCERRRTLVFSFSLDRPTAPHQRKTKNTCPRPPPSPWPARPAAAAARARCRRHPKSRAAACRPPCPPWPRRRAWPRSRSRPASRAAAAAPTVAAHAPALAPCLVGRTRRTCRPPPRNRGLAHLKRLRSPARPKRKPCPPRRRRKRPPKNRRRRPTAPSLECGWTAGTTRPARPTCRPGPPACAWSGRNCTRARPARWRRPFR
jgi:hypothetical protein